MTYVYDPGDDMAERYPGWVVRKVALRGVPELLCRRRRVILLERSLSAAEYRCALAHAVAHLDLGHEVAMDRRAETREEIAADDLAAERLMPLWRFADVGAWSMSPQEAAVELDVTEALLLIRWDGLGPAELDHVRGRVAAREDAA